MQWVTEGSLGWKVTVTWVEIPLQINRSGHDCDGTLTYGEQLVKGFAGHVGGMVAKHFTTDEKIYP
jgi:hypothetical protein